VIKAYALTMQHYLQTNGTIGIKKKETPKAFPIQTISYTIKPKNPRTVTIIWQLI
jgi:hypothetical protein